MKIPAPAAEAIMKGMAVNSADRIQSADELLAGLEKEEEEQPDGEETRTLYVPPVKSAPDPAPVPEPAPVPASKPAKIQKTGKAGNKKLIIGIVAAALAVAAAVGGVIWFVMNRNSGPAVPEDKLDLVVRTTDNEVPVGQVFQIDVDLLYKDGYENTEYSWEVFSDKEEIATAAYAGAKQRESASGNYLKTGLISVKGISPGETYIYIEIKNSSEILDVEAFEVVVTEAEETTEEKTTKETTTAEETTAEETTTKLDISALLSAYITTKEADSGVYLRKSANEDAKTPELLKRGTEVKIIEKQGDWYKVAVNGKTGYIKSEYISYKKVYPFSVGYVKGGVYYNDWANIKCSFLDGGNTTGQDNCGGEIGPIMFSTRNSSNDLRVFIGYKKCNINDAVSSNYDTGPYNSVIAGRQCVCYDGRTDEGLLYSRFLRDCYVQVDDYTIIVRLVASDKESLDDLQNMIQKLS